MRIVAFILMIMPCICGICQTPNQEKIVEAFNNAQCCTKEGKYVQAKDQYLIAFHLGEKLLSPFQLHSGLGVQQSATEAMKWYKISADNGHPEAAFYCGYSYHNGEGVPQDYTKALHYYYLASKSIPNANLSIGLLVREGLGEPKNEKKAYEYIKTGAEMGSPDAQYVLAHGYLMGYGDLPVNKQLAKSWMMKAAQQGNVLAQIWLNENQ